MNIIYHVQIHTILSVCRAYRTAIMYTVVVGCEARKFDGDKFRRLGRLLIRNNNLISKRVLLQYNNAEYIYGRIPLRLYNNIC